MFILRDLLRPPPSPFFRYRPGTGASLIIGLHAAGCHRPIHIVHDLQLTAVTVTLFGIDIKKSAFTFLWRLRHYPGKSLCLLFGD